ncbi:DNA-directed RNA polymerase subunit beta' [compost metagenome]
MGCFAARDLLAMPEDDLWKIPQDEYHRLVLADGEVEIVGADLINTVYLWYPMLDYPQAPILTSYVHGSDMEFTSGSNLKVLKTLLWGVHAHYSERVDPELLALAAMRTMNRWYNVITIRCSSKVATMSILDVLEVMDHPDIKQANATVEGNRHSIEEVTYKTIERVLKSRDDLPLNPIAMGIRCGTQKIDQVKQCFGPRGYVTDINSDIFEEPVLKGYVEGIWDLYGSMIESRSGTKALAYNKELLRNTEYFNRKTQLIAQYVRGLAEGDCGTPYYQEVPVIKALLKILAGKYYLNEKTNALDWIRGDEEHLIGTTIKMRGVMTCVHPGAGIICSVCYGRLSYSVPRHTNIGQVSAVQVGDKITSNVLSTKHTDVTSRVDRLQLSKVEGDYLRYGKQEEALYLRAELNNKAVRMVIDKNEATNLADILMLKDLSGYPVTNATELSQVHIQVETAEGTVSDILTVSLYNRKSSLTIEVLEYLRKHKWEYDSRGNLIIDLSNFDTTKPILILPNKHVNMYEVMKRIRSFLHSGSDDGAKSKLDPLEYSGKIYLKNFKDPTTGLLVFTNMLNEKLKINIVHCEILVYAMMVRSAVHRDYRLPKPGIDGVFEKYNRLMLNRSLSGAMAFEKQHEPFNNPACYLTLERDDHPYDHVLLGGKMN